MTHYSKDSDSERIEKILENGWIKSKLFSTKSAAELWQAKVTMELTQTAVQALKSLLVDAKITELKKFKAVFATDLSVEAYRHHVKTEHMRKKRKS